VPAAVGDFLILQAVRDSGGAAMAVSDQAILAAQANLARSEGLLLCPESAATLAAWEQAVQQRLIDPDARVVLFNCATGLKYPMPAVQP
jgi:threonine synthase